MLLQEWALFWANYFVTAPLNDRRVDEVCQGFIVRTRTRFTSKQPHIFPQEQWQSHCGLLSRCQLIQNDLIKTCARSRATLADRLNSKWQICELWFVLQFQSNGCTPPPLWTLWRNLWGVLCVYPALTLYFHFFKQTKSPASVNGDSRRSIGHRIKTNEIKPAIKAAGKKE